MNMFIVWYSFLSITVHLLCYDAVMKEKYLPTWLLDDFVAVTCTIDCEHTQFFLDLFDFIFIIIKEIILTCNHPFNAWLSHVIQVTISILIMVVIQSVLESEGAKT